MRLTANCMNGMLGYRFYILSNSFDRIYSICSKIALNITYLTLVS